MRSLKIWQQNFKEKGWNSESIKMVKSGGALLPGMAVSVWFGSNARVSAEPTFCLLLCSVMKMGIKLQLRGKMF